MNTKKQHKYEVIYEVQNRFTLVKETRVTVVTLNQLFESSHPMDVYDLLPPNANIIHRQKLEN